MLLLITATRRIRAGSTPALGEHVAWHRGPVTGSDQP